MPRGDLVAILTSVVKRMFYPEPELPDWYLLLILRLRRIHDLKTQFWLLRGSNWLWALLLVPLIPIALLMIVSLLLEAGIIDINIAPETGQAWSIATKQFILNTENWLLSKDTLLGLLWVLGIAVIVKIVFTGTASTRIHDRYTPLLKSLAESGNPDAAFELAGKAAAKGSEWWCKHWLQNAADLGHKEARRLLRHLPDDP